MCCCHSVSDIVHENLKMGSDGESDQASGTSSDEVQSPTGVCLRNRLHRRISMEARHTHTRCSLTANKKLTWHYSTLHPLSFCSAHVLCTKPCGRCDGGVSFAPLIQTKWRYLHFRTAKKTFSVSSIPQASSWTFLMCCSYLLDADLPTKKRLLKHPAGSKAIKCPLGPTGYLRHCNVLRLCRWNMKRMDGRKKENSWSSGDPLASMFLISRGVYMNSLRHSGCRPQLVFHATVTLFHSRKASWGRIPLVSKK